jgi:integrase
MPGGRSTGKRSGLGRSWYSGRGHGFPPNWARMEVNHMQTIPDIPVDAQPIYRPVPWHVLRDELDAVYRPPAVVQGTRCKMMQTFRELEALGVANTSDLTIQTLARYLASRRAGESAYTTHGALAVVRTICTYAETAGYLRINPFRLRKLSKWIRLPAIAGKRHLTKQEIRSILDLMIQHVEQRRGWAQWRSRRLLVATTIIAYTGLRKMECLNLHVDDVDLDAGIIWVRSRGRRLKTRASEAPIPIPSALRPYLVDWCAHRMDAPVGFSMPASCP